jgi:drug/metabolite transporter (DMT)-like permease
MTHVAWGAGSRSAQLVSILFALGSACCTAANLLTQRVSSRNVGGGSVWLVARNLLRNRLWLIGVAAAVAAFALQAAALHGGRLSVVQPVLVTELIFVLVLRWVWLRQHVRTAAWGSAGLTCAGLVVFLAAAEPRGGNPSPAASAWLWVIAAFGGASLVLTVLAVRGSPARRAALYAAASAIVGALEATFIKTSANTLTTDGVSSMLTQWPVYALAVSALIGTVLVQAALHVGPLTVSQPLMVVINPLVSIALSVLLFDEYFTADTAAILVAACSFAAMAVGVVLQTLTGPQHISSTPVAAMPR